MADKKISKGGATTVHEEKEKVCPITKAQFEKKATPIKVTIGESTIVAVPRDFKEDKDGLKSFGFFFNERVVIEIDGVPCKCIANCNVTVIHSKLAK